MPPERRIDLVLRWLKKVENATGMKTVIYTLKGCVKDYLPGAESVKDHPLWVADFKSTDTPRIVGDMDVLAVHRYRDGARRGQ